MKVILSLCRFKKPSQKTMMICSSNFYQYQIYEIIKALKEEIKTNNRFYLFVEFFDFVSKIGFIILLLGFLFAFNGYILLYKSM